MPRDARVNQRPSSVPSPPGHPWISPDLWSGGCMSMLHAPGRVTKKIWARDGCHPFAHIWDGSAWVHGISMICRHAVRFKFRCSSASEQWNQREIPGDQPVTTRLLAARYRRRGDGARSPTTVHAAYAGLVIGIRTSGHGPRCRCL